MQRKIDAVNEIDTMLQSFAPQYAHLLLSDLEREYLELIRERIDLLEQVKVKDPFSAMPIDDLRRHWTTSDGCNVDTLCGMSIQEHSVDSSGRAHCARNMDVRTLWSYHQI